MSDNQRQTSSMTYCRPVGAGGDGDQSHRVQNKVLLPPDHFLRSSSQGPLLGAPQHAPGSQNGLPNLPQMSPGPGTLGSVLLNLDIPVNKFGQAINFEAFQQGSQPTPPQLQQNWTELDADSNDLCEDASLEDNDDDDENLAEQSLVSEAASDLVEQQQCMAQSQLLERFKHLRQMQAQQQDILLRQQAEQMRVLKAEQEKMHRLVARQRETQWGGSAAQAPHVSSRSPPSSHQRDRVPCGLPQALAQGALELARNQGHVTSTPPASTAGPIKRGRPVPNLAPSPSTPSDYRDSGNPDLDSDTNTIASRVRTPPEEGVCPLPDTASEDSDPPVAYFNSDRQGAAASVAECDSSSDKENGAHRDSVGTRRRSGPPIPFPRCDVSLEEANPQRQVLGELAGQRPGAAANGNPHSASGSHGNHFDDHQQSATRMPASALHNQLSANGAQSQSRSNGHRSAPSGEWQQTDIHLNPQSATLLENGVHSIQALQAFLQQHQQSYPSRSGLRGLQPTYDDVIMTQSQALSPDCDVRGVHGSESQGDDDLEEQYYQDNGSDLLADIEEREGEEYSEGEDYSYDEDSGGRDPEQPAVGDNREAGAEHSPGVSANTNFDDLPVVGIDRKRKTFEELLEEELRKEQERLKVSSGEKSPVTPPSASGGKVFLRRGQGTARFGMSARKPSQAATRGGLPGNTTRAPASSSAVVRGGVKATVGSTSGGAGITAGDARRKSVLSKKTSASEQAKKVGFTETGRPAKGAPVTTRTAQVKLGAAKPRGKLPGKLTLKASHSQKAEPQLLESPAAVTPAKPEASGEPDASILGESSFHNKMKKLESTERAEKGELEEFEILERYADDNASFLSNVSEVNRVVRRESAEQGFNGKSNGPGDTKQKSHVAAGKPWPPSRDVSDEDGDVTLIEDPDDDTRSASPMPQSQGMMGRNVQRKVASLGSRSPSKNAASKVDSQPQMNGQGTASALRQVEQFSDSEADEEIDPKRAQRCHPEDASRGLPSGVSNHQDLDESTENETESESESSESEDDETDESEHEQSASDNLSDSDRATTRGKNHGNHDDNNMQRKSPKESGFESRVLHQDTARPAPEAPPRDCEFGDEESWGDCSGLEGEESPGGVPSPGNPRSPSRKPSVVLGGGLGGGAKGPIIRTKVFPAQGNGFNNGSDEGSNATPPPTSNLVARLFPKLKQDNAKQQLTQEQAEKLKEASRVAPSDGPQSKALREKLRELENEIDKFRRENATLEKLRAEREQGLEHLKKEMSEFDKQKNEELKRLQDFKAEETKKLRRERKLFDQYQKATRAVPNKKEREEIESLKSQLTEAQEEARRKEQRWTASTARLRDRIQLLETENQQLQQEVQLLERKRLEAWQQREAPPSGGGKREEPRRATERPSDDDVMAVGRNGQTVSESDVPHRAQGKKSPSTQSNGLPGQAPGPQAATLTDSGPPRPRSASKAAPMTSQHAVPQPSQSPGVSPRQEVPSSAPTPLAPNPSGSSLPQPPASRKVAPAVSISGSVDKGDEHYDEVQHPDGKVERVYHNGAREILFSNGTRKQVSADGQSIIVSFFNGDMKQILPDQRVVYYYADAQTTHTTYPDGLEIINFPNNQCEKHYPDGTKEITFPDQIIKYLFPSGVEESIFPDGTVIRVEQSGDKVMEFPNGQREVHTQQYKRREYPDGTVKTVFPDGRQETRYSSGRIRVKDKEGHVIVDRRM